MRRAWMADSWTVGMERAWAPSGDGLLKRWDGEGRLKAWDAEMRVRRVLWRCMLLEINNDGKNHACCPERTLDFVSEMVVLANRG